MEGDKESGADTSHAWAGGRNSEQVCAECVWGYECGDVGQEALLQCSGCKGWFHPSPPCTLPCVRCGLHRCSFCRNKGQPHVCTADHEDAEEGVLRLPKPCQSWRRHHAIRREGWCGTGAVEPFTSPAAKGSVRQLVGSRVCPVTASFSRIGLRLLGLCAAGGGRGVAAGRRVLCMRCFAAVILCCAVRCVLSVVLVRWFLRRQSPQAGWFVLWARAPAEASGAFRSRSSCVRARRFAGVSCGW